MGFNDDVISEFREHNGEVGGPFKGAPILLLTTTGAKSGMQRTNPMMYLPDGDRCLVFASYAGRDENPAWFHNLVADPSVTVEIGTDKFAATAEVLERAERDKFYARQAELYPGFADYEKKTSRIIPVVALTRAS